MTKTIDLDTLVLAKGGHGSIEQGACLLEAASYIAGERWSDQPQCVSVVLGAFGRRLNDNCTDEERQQLKPFIPRLLNTADDGKDGARAFLAADWLVRDALPRLLETFGRAEEAQQLRALAAITDRQTDKDARPVVQAIRNSSQQLRAEGRDEFVAWLTPLIAAKAKTAGDAGAAWDAWDAGDAGDAWAAGAAGAAGDAGDADRTAIERLLADAATPAAFRSALRTFAREAILSRWAPAAVESRASAIALFDRMIDAA